MEYNMFLKEVELFDGLSDEELYEVSRSVRETAVTKGATIIEEGTPGDSLYILKKGKVTIVRESGDEKVVLAELEPPKFFGEMSLIDDYPHSAKVKAVEDCEMLLINRLDLEIILNWNTVLGLKLWRAFSKVLSERLRDTNAKIMERMFNADDTVQFRMWEEVIK